MPYSTPNRSNYTGEQVVRYKWQLDGFLNSKNFHVYSVELQKSGDLEIFAQLCTDLQQFIYVCSRLFTFAASNLYQYVRYKQATKSAPYKTILAFFSPCEI